MVREEVTQKTKCSKNKKIIINFYFLKRIYQQLSQHSVLVQERVREILVVLSEGSQGTQACINAAQTVSGIIGDLDTTILFATSGSLNSPQKVQKQQQFIPDEFLDHRDVILKTAKVFNLKID